MSKRIQFHWQLEVYQLSIEAGMAVFDTTKSFPAEEKFSLTDQIRRSTRSVSGQSSEGWRKRKYEASFVNKLNDAEGEAAETQTWLEYAVRCGYVSRPDGQKLQKLYDLIIGKLVTMGNNPEPWLLRKTGS